MTIRKTDINGWARGVSLISSSLNTLSENRITNNSPWGIYGERTSLNEITKNTIAYNSHADISLNELSNHNTIDKNSITHSQSGILIGSSSSDNIVSENSIAHHSGCGILLILSSNANTLQGNEITNNKWGVGVYHFSNYNIIRGNRISYSFYDGLIIHNSTHNTIFENSIRNNGQFGVTIAWLGGNKFYHNDFIGNYRQISCGLTTNAWDDGYPSGGNYWSDYTGVDLKSGPNQNQPGSDGIGDTQYTIDSNNTDRYPLMKILAIHDIAVADVKPCKTIVGQGYSMRINVTVANQGGFTETFNITAHANTTTIQTRTLTLESGNYITITFAWNTTGWNKGNYTLKAFAATVWGETDTADNTCIDGVVTVASVGDVNADRKVDMKDVAAIARAFGSKLGDSLYTPNYDIDDNEKIDMKDVAAAAKNFGKTDT